MVTSTASLDFGNSQNGVDSFVFNLGAATLIKYIQVVRVCLLVFTRLCNFPAFSRGYRMLLHPRSCRNSGQHSWYRNGVWHIMHRIGGLTAVLALCAAPALAQQATAEGTVADIVSAMSATATQPQPTRAAMLDASFKNYWQ
jgi:hypothetical protein